MLATRPPYSFSRYFDCRAVARNCLKVLLVVAMVGASLFAMPIRSLAGEDAYFNVDVEGDGVWGGDWDPNSSVTVEVFESDHSTSKSGAIVTPTDESNNFGLDLRSEDPAVDVVPGDHVDVTQGTVTKTHSVTDLSAAYDTDSVVGGSAAPGFIVLVWVHDSDAWRNETATGGAWSANFAVAGDEPGEEATIDLGPGNNGAAHQCDVDNDCTFAFWDVPELPSFSVRIDEGQVHGYQWPLGADVTLEIDDPGTPGVEYTKTLPPEEAPWDPDQTFVQFNTADEGFTLVAGQSVSMFNGDVTKTHTVTDLTVVDVNATADTVSGTTSSGFDSVNVNINHESGQYRNVAVVDDAWTADFSIPSDDHEPWDIAPGTNGEANEGDDDGDSTQRSWGIANPAITVETPFSVWSTGDGWIEGATASLSIDDGSGGGPEYADSVLIERWGPDPSEVGFNFHTDSFEIQPGFVVTVTDGVTTKVLDVADVTVDVVDAEADFIEGTAPDETWVNVNAGNDWDWCDLDVFSAPDGSWVANFSGDPCHMDLAPGTNGAAQVYDDDGNSTHRSWGIANPSIRVDAGNNNVWGHEWSAGTVEVSVDGLSWTVPVSEGSEDQNPGDFNLDLNNADPTWDVTPGDEITVVHSTEAESKTHVVTGLTAAYDVDSVVSGTAVDGSDVDVWVHDTDVGRHEIATGGVWSTDFSVEGDEDGEESTVVLGPGNNGAAAQCDGDGDCTFAFWDVPQLPVFGVDPVHDQVEGWGWGSDVEVTVTIPGSPLGTYSWGTDWEGQFWFNIHDWPEHERFDITPGMLVTVTDGPSTKTLVVSDLVVNPPTGPDRIPIGATELFGTGDAGQGGVVVEVHSMGENLPVTFTGSDWESDPFTSSVGQGDHGVVAQSEPDDGEGLGDQTRIYWRVPQPAFTVNPDQDHVWGWEFEPNVSVDIGVSGAPMTYSVMADGDGQIDFNLQYDAPPTLGHDLVPGDLVTVDDGTTVKDHVVIDLSVGVDADTDVVSGSTDLFNVAEYHDVDVWVNGGPGWSVTPDGSGSWGVDFMAEFGHDIHPGDTGGVNQPDDDGDRTQLAWMAEREPMFGVDPVHDQVEGWGWGSDVEVTVTIPGSPLGTYSWGTDWEGQFWFNIHDWPEHERFDITPGMLVTVTDGPSTKTLVVSDLVVNPPTGPDRIPIGATELFGTGDAGQGGVVVEVHSMGENLPVTFTGSDWESDPFTSSVGQGDHGVVAQSEPDDGEGLGDQTRIYWRVPQPAFTVNPDQDHVWGWEFEPNVSVDIGVSGAPMTYSVMADGDGQIDFNLQYDAPPTLGHDLVPGDLVTVDDGTTVKDHVVIDLSVGVDADTDVVSGSTDLYGVAEYHDVDVWADGGPRWWVIPDAGDGSWGVDFMAEFGHDIQPGDTGGVNQPDVDGDRTQIDWDIPRVPNFSVRIDEGEVHGYNWPLGTDVTLEIDDPGNGVGVDYSETLAPEEAPWDSEGTVVGFPVADGGWMLEAGQLVSMTNGDVTKTHTVTDLEITVVDEVNDVIAGTTSSGIGDIHVEVYDGGPYRAAANVAGVWSADFSVPWEGQGTWDIGPGSHGEAAESDADGDSTQRSWGIPNPRIRVDAGSNRVWGREWSAGAVEVAVDGVSWTVPVSEGSEDQDPGDFNLDLNNADPTWDVMPGDVITVTHATEAESKTHTVTGLTAVHDVDSVVTGTAADGSDVDVWVHDTDVWRHEVAAAGVWSADFAIPGDEEGEEPTIDLGRGNNGGAAQCDDDGDCTIAEWNIPNPAFTVETPFDVWSTGDGWINGATATLTVDDGGSGYTDTVLIEWQGPEMGIGFGFHTSPYEILPGFTVTVTDGVTTKVLEVVEVTVDVVDEDADVVAGMAPGDTWVNVNAGNDWEECGLEVLSESDGSWLAEFGEDPCYMDLAPGFNGSAQVHDDDGDSTHRGWRITNPHFTANSGHDGVWGDEWVPDDSVTVEVFEPDETTSKSGSVVVPTDEWGQFGLDLGVEDPPVDVIPGDYVMVTQGATVKDHVVIDLMVDVVAVGTNAVSGSTNLFNEPFYHDVHVWVHDGPWSSVTPDAGDGSWGVDFMTEHGHVIEFGDGGGVNQRDDDGDGTYVGWEAVNVPPTNDVPPSVSGVAKVGESLTVDRGSWSGTPEILYSYQWLRCNSGGSACSEIMGANGLSYVPVPDDVGSTIVVEVTAQNPADEVTVQSAATAVVQVADVAVSNVTLPSVSGVSKVGETLAGNAGSWSGTAPIAYAYQWLRCNSGGTSCSTISGATGLSYAPVSADVGRTIRFKVTATNVVNSLAKQSAATAVVKAADVAVSNTSLPSVSGVAKVGKSLSGNRGSWSGTAPIAYAYQWLRCNSGGSSCSTISGATGLSYAPVSGDVGRTIRFKVTATNVVNSLAKQSAATAVVKAADVAVSNTPLPSVSGVAKVGETLTGNRGSWSGTAPIAYAYRWLRCNSGGSSCSTITGATGLSYAPVSGDVGRTIRFKVTASNVVNSLVKQSAATAVVKAATVPPSGPPFKDTVGNIHLSAIEAIRAAGITKGCNPPTNDMFCPASSVTRGQMAAFLNRALSLRAADRDYFTDDDDSVFEDDINRVAAAGITKGCNPPANDHFCPTDTVSREQMAAFLTRMLKLPPTDRDYFTDDDDSIFEDDINRFAKAGITRGCNPPANTNYCPVSPVRRDEMATFLTRALGLPAG